jgi:hypothetical protein
MNDAEAGKRLPIPASGPAFAAFCMPKFHWKRGWWTPNSEPISNGFFAGKGVQSHLSLECWSMIFLFGHLCPPRVV